MSKFFENRFALTKQGANDLVRASILSFLVYVINMLPAILLMLFMDELILHNIKDKYIYIGLSIFILVVMYIVLSVEYDSLYNATYKESANLRIDIAETLSKLPLSYFSKHDLSDLSQTIMADVESLEHAMSHSMSKVVGFFLYFPIVSILLVIGNVKLGFAVVVPIILNLLFIWISKKAQIKENLRHYEKLRDNSESFQEVIENQQDIKSFGLSRDIKKSLYKKMEESEKIHLKAEFITFIPMAISGLILQIALPVVIILGIRLYGNGEINVLYILGYILAAMKIKEGVDAVGQNMTEIFYLDARINRIKDIRNAEIQEGHDCEINNFNIEFKNVFFSYNDDNEVIKNMSFTAVQDEVTALVGVSGCGKTSVLRLISRLYDYDDGKIMIGEKDIKDISTRSLFKNISIVFQDVTLFDTSVMENIRIGKRDATDEEVKQAARLANCEEFIDKLPLGYDTPIGENGNTLSGGERQRLSIARAFLKDAPIIILDEISASLDVENEKYIQDSLNKLTRNKTVIIISHRLKAIENVDKIVVIDDGKVVAFGKHHDLIESSKIYAGLVKSSRLVEEFKY